MSSNPGQRTLNLSELAKMKQKRSHKKKLKSKNTTTTDTLKRSSVPALSNEPEEKKKKRCDYESGENIDTDVGDDESECDSVDDELKYHSDSSEESDCSDNNSDLEQEVCIPVDL